MAERASTSSSSSTAASAPQCSICLEVVVDNHGRSTTRLQCGHVFHLDCIGSEFNIKGVMQCPNCREIENGDWLFAAGGFDQSIDDTDEDDDFYPIDMIPPRTQWCPFSGFPVAPPPSRERGFTQTTNPLTEEVLIVGGASNPLVINPCDGHHHQMATCFPMPSSMNDIQLHQQSWIPQTPFLSMGNTMTAANQALNSPSTLEFAGIFSFSVPSQASSAQTFTHRHWSTGNSPPPPPLTRFRMASRELPSNSPSPGVLGSMLRRRRGSSTNPTRPLQAEQTNAGFTMFPSSSELSTSSNASNEVPLPPRDHGVMQQGQTSEIMPPQNKTHDCEIKMYQFL